MINPSLFPLGKMGIAGPGAILWQDQLPVESSKADFSRWQLESFSQTLRAREDGQFPSSLTDPWEFGVDSQVCIVPMDFCHCLGMGSDPEEGSPAHPIPMLWEEQECSGLDGEERFPGNHIPVPAGPRERLHIHMIPKSLSSFPPHQRITRCTNSSPALGSFSLGTQIYSRTMPSPTAGIWDGAGALRVLSFPIIPKLLPR